ncbi:hypothetical protein YPF_0698 [Yersinia pestis biovar Orientalis str. India 195]|nr:hypothetical protein YP516_0273 [Yersinia pestis Nepal516]EEO82726.1 hypothetical protein YPF_0698 [Yersinia pestis biovar Orientalis str. India 195]EEO86697.1 hypothetical protein YPH_2618 [Yersinia pestis biovar Orientalis str. PEXU2]EEO91969.1 hypothetical protein YPS_0917 [Yersinia pestis Pestoides A]
MVSRSDWQGEYLFNTFRKGRYFNRAATHWYRGPH